MTEFLTVLWNFVCGMGILGMLGILFVAYYALREGLIPAATGFVSLFFLICFFGWDKWLGDEFMTKLYRFNQIGIINRSRFSSILTSGYHTFSDYTFFCFELFVSSVLPVVSGFLLCVRSKHHRA